MMAAAFRDIRRRASAVRTALFPPQCLSCGARGSVSEVPLLCADCFGNVSLPPPNRCAVCGRPLEFSYEIETGETYTCGACLDAPPPYRQMRTALVYEGPARELIHRFKFQSNRRLARALAGLGESALVPWLGQWPGAIIVPVPLSRARLFSRGYNPSYLLARHFGKWAGLETLEGGLRRVRHTTPQFGLNHDARVANVKGAFAIHDHALIEGKTVILFDDIVTTGATVAECCKTLGKAKPAGVIVAALCRAGVS